MFTYQQRFAGQHAGIIDAGAGRFMAKGRRAAFSRPLALDEDGDGFRGRVIATRLTPALAIFAIFFLPLLRF